MSDFALNTSRFGLDCLKTTQLSVVLSEFCAIEGSAPRHLGLGASMLVTQ